MSSRANPFYDMAPPPVDLPNPMPVQQRQPQPNQMAPAAGTGKVGQVANIASNFLHGMLAAKDVKEQKMQETARFSISSSWNTYQQLQATASDPSATPEARKMATDNLGKAYNVYMDNVTRYTNPGDKPKKKGASGVLSRVGGALTAQKPQLGTEDWINFMKSPQILQMMSQPHGPSAEQQASQLKLAEEQRIANQAKKVDDVTGKLAGSLSAPDANTEAGKTRTLQLFQQQRALTGTLTDKDLEDPKVKAANDQAAIAEAQLKGAMATEAPGAFDRFKQGTATDRDMSLLGAYGITKQKQDPYDIYQNMIGKAGAKDGQGKPVAWADGGKDNPLNQKRALDLYLENQAHWARVSERPSAYLEENAELKKNIKMSLKGELGREPTEEEVSQRWMQATGHVGGPAKTTAMPLAKQGEIQQDILGQLATEKGWSRFIGEPDSKGVRRINPNSDPSEKENYGKFLQTVASRLLDKGMSPSDVLNVTGTRGFGLSATPDGGKQGAKKTYTVTGEGGQPFTMDMSAEDLAAAKKKYPGWSFDDSGGKSSTAGGL